MKGRGDVDDALTRTGAARGQRCALPTVAAFAHITSATTDDYSNNDRGRLKPVQVARVGQIYFGDPAGKWVRFGSALTITSQLPIEHWHAWVGDATIADAILDRVMQRNHRFTLTGESLRQNPKVNKQEKPTDPS